MDSPFRYSKEELRVLSECNRESFYQRCLPFSTALGLTTYYAIKTGRLSGSPRFGVVPKVAGAVVVGYLMGKLSYQQQCAEKLMALPDSKLGEMLRKRNPQRKTLTMDFPESDKVMGQIAEDEKYDDVRKTSHMDIDTDRPPSTSLDDSYRPPFDAFGPPDTKDEPILTQQPSTTYDELRRKNREEYEQNRTKPYRGVMSPDEIPTALKGLDTGPQSTPEIWLNKEPPPPKKPTNIYGDTWE